MNAEHAALVALLRIRPEKRTWRRLTDEVRDSGSASQVWSAYNPDALIPPPEVTTALTEAETDLQKWDRDGLTLLSVLDQNSRTGFVTSLTPRRFSSPRAASASTTLPSRWSAHAKHHHGASS